MMIKKNMAEYRLGMAVLALRDTNIPLIDIVLEYVFIFTASSDESF
jgi:hypothetical protein